jgi:hypothetical protein
MSTDAPIEVFCLGISRQMATNQEGANVRHLHPDRVFRVAEVHVIVQVL